MSPVWNQPSGSIASRVAAGSLKYSRKMCGPRTRISPSAAIRISVPGSAFPTVPNLYRSNSLTAVTVEVSVSPYPSRMRTPMACRNSAISRDRGAPPEMK